SATEEARLNADSPFHEKAKLRGSWARYLPTVFDLSSISGRSSLPFPGPAPPGKKKAVRSLDDLPLNVRNKLSVNPPQAPKAAKGKWAQFALAVQADAHERGIRLPPSLLGPTKADEMPPSVRRFINDDLLPRLSEAERGQLSAAEGHWPEYPQKVKELTDRHA